ncbi:RNA-directed DNA polymerase, eukaryota, reverse transcriptase zinc-binding domain protein [Tanacetum coccineum]
MNGIVEYDGDNDTVNSQRMKDNGVIGEDSVDIEENVRNNVDGNDVPESVNADSEKIATETVNKTEEEITNSQSHDNETGKNVDIVDNLTNNNELFFVPTALKENGEEVVLFEEELVKEGSKKYELKDIVVDDDDICYFKFRHEEGMNSVIDQSPWLSVKGISIIASRFGRLIKMDKMTADMCKEGSGRLGYARVLVEIDAEKSYIDNVKINYVDDLKNVKITKWVNVEYSWKPERCSHCFMFGHTVQYCKMKPRVNEVNVTKGAASKQYDSADKEGFVEVRNKRNFRGQRDVGNKGIQGNNQAYRKEVGTKNDNIKFAYKPKIPDPKPVMKENVTHVKSNIVNIDMTPSNVEKRKVSKENVNELKKSANKYVVLSDEENEDCNVDPFIDKRLIVDEFIKKKIQPNCIETKDWTYDMIQYFKYQWEAMERMEKEDSEEDDVFESHNQGVNSLIADEVLVNGCDSGEASL